jgi:ABC-type polysaccharide/polyol phosphate transport system ATPase subunit
MVRDQDAVVMLDDVSVSYRMAVDAPLSIKEAFLRRRRRHIVQHLAVDGVTLRVRQGETLGIIGRNGAGKTTLLNVMSRVVPPSGGRLRIRGAVSPLIDLTGGFHNELTGRENVYLRGAVLGLRRAEMRPRISAIAAFADLGQFFDAPLRTYSTGMILRLGFALATSIDATILLVDEALAVGDAEFQAKCADRMREFRGRGVTFIVVSHDLESLAAMSDRILWMDKGRTRAIGPPTLVMPEYLAAARAHVP